MIQVDIADQRWLVDLVFGILGIVSALLAMIRGDELVPVDDVAMKYRYGNLIQ